MINRVVLTGRLTRDSELKTTQSGLSVSTFTLAVDRQYTNSQGERGADFISCVIWRKAAENFCNFTSKGSLVGIDGRIQTRTYDGQIQTRTYDNKNGQKVYVAEVVVDNFSLLESKKDRQNNANTSNNGGYSNSGNNSTSNNSNAQQDPFSGSGDTIDISDDDLPF